MAGKSFLQKKMGFLFIELLVAMAVFSLFVKALLVVHGNLIETEYSITRKLKALCVACKRIEERAVLSDSIQNRLMIEQTLAPIIFLIKNEQPVAVLNHREQRQALANYVSVRWKPLGKRSSAFSILGSYSK